MHRQDHIIYRIKPSHFWECAPMYQLLLYFRAYNSEGSLVFKFQIIQCAKQRQAFSNKHSKFCQVDLTFPKPFYFSFCIPGWQVGYLSTSHKAILACCGNRLQRNAGTRPALLVYTETGAKRGELCLQCWDPVSLPLASLLSLLQGRGNGQCLPTGKFLKT